MTPDRMAEILRILRSAPSSLAHALGMTRDRTVREWLNGRRPIPEPIADWLELMHRHQQTAPPPPFLLEGASSLPVRKIVLRD